MRSKKMIRLALILSAAIIALPFIYLCSGWAAVRASSRARSLAGEFYAEASKAAPQSAHLRQRFLTEEAWKKYRAHERSAGRVRKVEGFDSYAQILGTPSGCVQRVLSDKWYFENLGMRSGKVSFFVARYEGASSQPGDDDYSLR